MINENDILTLTHTHTHTPNEHMGRTHQIIIFTQIQNNHKLLLPIHTVKIYMQKPAHLHTTHYTYGCVNKAYFKCLDIFAYEYIQNYIVDSFVSMAANKLHWRHLDFSWLWIFHFSFFFMVLSFFYHSVSLCDLINSSSVQRNIFPFCRICLFLLLLSELWLNSIPSIAIIHSFIRSVLYDFLCCCRCGV